MGRRQFLNEKARADIQRSMKSLLIALLSICTAIDASAAAGATALPCHEILVVDQESGRGVPLVELTAVNHLKFVTDSAGRAAFCEPGLENQLVGLSVKSHGYEFPKDGFGYPIARVKITAGGKTVLKIKRLNLAERLYRITGEGIYRDSLLLGNTPPIEQPMLNAEVVGQDSTLAAVYKGKIFWFWGDTSWIEYPLGNFRTTGATSDLPGKGGLPVEQGINLHYFKASNGFTKPLCPWEKLGLIWIDGVSVVTDATGKERLVCHFSHRESLVKEFGHGFAVWNDEKEEFEKIVDLPMSEKWRFIRNHPVRHKEGNETYLYFGGNIPTTRVKATLDAVTNTVAYEGFTCASSADSGPTSLNRDAGGKLVWAWSSKANPATQKDETEWIKAGLMKPEEARFQLRENGKTNVIELHGGSVAWNEFRDRWIMIVLQKGGSSSLLGEVWYAEAPEPTGPWTEAVKVVTHDRYTFYNPVHHPFLDEQGGRFIYFEGTYAESFSGNPVATPRYDYNQVMYRLDLAKLPRQ